MSSDVIVDLPMPQYTTRDRDTEVSRSSPVKESHKNAAYTDSDSDEDQADVDQDEGVQHETCNLNAALQASMPTSVYMEGSRDVQIGSRLHYNAPVTINQYVHVLRPDSETQEEAVAESRTNGNNNNACSLNNNKPREYTPGVTVTTVKPPLSPSHWGLISGAAILIIAGLMLTVYYFKTGGPPPAEDMPVLPPPDHDLSSKGYLQILLRGPRHCVLLSVALAVVTAALLILVILLTVQQQVITRNPKEDEYESTFKYADTNTTLSGRLRILTRREWLAQPPLHQTDSLYHPVPYVIISHTATEPCVKQADCTFFVRTVQTFHIESFGWWDIGYNFLVGGDGYAYEGRGWNHVGAHALGYNNVSIGISIIGTFISVLPPDSQLLAAKQLIRRGVELGKVSPNYKLLGHRQVSATESPGTALYDEIKTWPNWVEKP